MEASSSHESLFGVAKQNKDISNEEESKK